MNMKFTRTLFMLALTLVIGLSVTGGTIAWFTDSVTSSNNVIQSGNLDVELSYQLPGETDWTPVTERTNLFKADALWEPGHTEVIKLKVSNVGNLALKYDLGVNVASETGSVNVLGDAFNLSDYIEFGVADGELDYNENRDEAVAAVGANARQLSEEYISAVTPLNPSESKVVTMVVYMPTSVGNEANYAKGEAVPAINLGINLLATQMTEESDSFGKDYDKYASVATVADMKAALAAGTTEFNFMGSEINLNYGLNKTMVPAGSTITIANAVVSGKSYGNAADGTVIFEDCTFTNTGAYSIHFDAGNGDVIFKNCELYGWNSFGSSLNSVSFYDCSLYGNGTYALIRSYADLHVENCHIDTTNANHTDKYSEGVEAVEGAALTEKNNTYVAVATTLSEVMELAKKENTTIDAKGANLGDFNYNGTFANGTVLKNAKFTYVYGASVDGVATFENCEFVSDHSYSANFSDGSYTGKVIFNNCYFDGWNSFGDAITSVEMNNCTFDKAVGQYGILRFYQDAVLNNCVIKNSFEGIDTNKTGTVVKLNDCTGIEGKIYNNGDKIGQWIVDGVELTNVPTW